MRDQNREAAWTWFEQAVVDRRAAAHARKGGFHAHACFSCQQAGEKALKAALHARRRRAIRTHATENLVKEAAQYYPALAEVLPGCCRLDRYYATTRYPNALGGASPHDNYGPEDSHAAMADARAVVAAVAEALGFEVPEADRES